MPSSFLSCRHKKILYTIFTKEVTTVEYRKKFSSLNELLESEEFKNRDLSYCDLEGIDLSGLSWKNWKQFKFYHTNFKDTNIVFEPSSLKTNEQDFYCLEYCDFTGCDLSYIKSLAYASIKGSRLLGTRLEVRLMVESREEIEDVVFPEEMVSEVRYIAPRVLLTAHMLQINPHIPFSSLEIYIILKGCLPGRDFYVPAHKHDDLCVLIDRYLEEDRRREGALCRLFESVGGKKFSKAEKILFFQGFICNKAFTSLDLASIPVKLLDKFNFVNCRIENLTLPDGEISSLSIIDETAKYKVHSIIPHVVLTGVDHSSWQREASKRVGRTIITRQTNLYLELGRICNARCPFCRNRYLKEDQFDPEAVMKSFRAIEPYLNNVVIGGGEPTLSRTREILEDLRYKRENFDVTYFISTNGSCREDYLIDLVNKLSYRINLSRHALEDADNDEVFGIKTAKIEDIKYCVAHAYYNYFTLVATCFKGGIDSVDAMERYIELANYLQINSILFQSMHEDLEGEFGEMQKRAEQIDEMVFDEIIARLREQNYFVSELPIYSTGDYKLIIVKSSDESKTYSFKKYISREELEREWPRATKRTFDLSIAPNGDIFQNWHQSSDKVMCIKPQDKKREF